MLLFAKSFPVKKEVWDGALSWCNSEFVCRPSSGQSLRMFAAVAVKCHSGMRHWLFGLPGRILCEQYPWCQRKWWACSWLCSSPVSPFFQSRWALTCHANIRLGSCFLSPTVCLISARVSVEFLSEICTKSDAVPLSDPSRNLIRPDTRLQIRGTWEIRTSTQLREILYTDFQDMLVLSPTGTSRYYNCCKDGSTSAGNYEYPLIPFIAILPLIKYLVVNCC
jgi:hypothetical protein